MKECFSNKARLFVACALERMYAEIALCNCLFRALD